MIYALHAVILNKHLVKSILALTELIIVMKGAYYVIIN